MIDKEIYDKRFICNLSNCECKYDKSCGFGEYLDYENCKSRKNVEEELVEECTKTIDGVKIAGIALFELENECKFSCTIYVVLIAIIFTVRIGIGTYFIYYRYMNHDKKTDSDDDELFLWYG